MLSSLPLVLLSYMDTSACLRWRHSLDHLVVHPFRWPFSHHQAISGDDSDGADMSVCQSCSYHSYNDRICSTQSRRGSFLTTA
ncbi:hypothetical protein BT63DRAFT_94241 [Microthyrium microscopicum]|uniref:Uncharacterized protein n=1 Tax=Microthyrium microscopicum TaxID=703497 RepID=A0A6A6U0J0_9PEZI|nr:hypothetical protein BT63DRAFT_94241 [Microthyrium microscopicum]